MSVAHQLGSEYRCAPFFVVRRSRGADNPACFGDARIGLSAEAHKQRRHAGARGGKAESPARHEIENFWLRRNLGDDRAERGAREPFTSRAQHARRIGHADQDHALGVETHFEQAVRIKLAEFERGKILPYPQQLLVSAHPHGEARGEARSRASMTRIKREDLMQRAFRQSALEA